MSHFDFEEIQVLDDSVDDIDIIRDIIKTEKLEDPFYVVDIGDIIKKHQEWISKMPKVVPHYGTFTMSVAFFFRFRLYCYIIFRKTFIAIKINATHLFEISAIKCNANSTVIKVLAALNASFDCASKVKKFSLLSQRNLNFQYLYKMFLKRLVKFCQRILSE